jgi:exosortase
MSQASTTLNPRGLDYSGFDDGDRQPLSPEANRVAWTVFGVLLAALTSAYMNMLEFTSTYWVKDMYSHGWIVPLFAGYLFWLRSRSTTLLSQTEMMIGGAIVAACAAVHWYDVSSEGALSSLPGFGLFLHLEVWAAAAMLVYCVRDVRLMEATPLERWIGVAIVAGSLGLRVWAATIDMNVGDRLTYVTALLGLALIVGGWSMLRWAGPALAFVIFMFPLPYFIENTMLMKLQTFATVLSTWSLQLLGVSAGRMANTISIDGLQEPLQVAEACSGLRMLTIFGAMSVALAMIIERPWWDRLIILLSAVPIALASNIIRIVATALLYIAFGQDNETVNHIIHDWAGFAMMPVGLGLLWIELTILSRLTVPMDAEEDFVGFGAAAG